MHPIVSFLLMVVIIPIVTPFLVYFCVKFGTVAFYKAKQFIDKQKTGDIENE